MFFPFTGHHASCAFKGNHRGKNQILILQDPKLGPRLPKRKAILGAMNLAGILLRIGRALDFRSLGMPWWTGNRRWTEWTDLGSWAKGEISKFHDFMNIHFWCVLMCVDVCWYVLIYLLHSHDSHEFLPGKEKVDPDHGLFPVQERGASPCPNRSRIAQDTTWLSLQFLRKCWATGAGRSMTWQHWDEMGSW